MDYFIEWRKRAAGRPNYLHRMGCYDTRKTSENYRRYEWVFRGGDETMRDCPTCIQSGDREEAAAQTAAQIKADEDATAARIAKREALAEATIAPWQQLLEHVRPIYPDAALFAVYLYDPAEAVAVLGLHGEAPGSTRITLNPGGDHQWSGVPRLATSDDIKRLADVAVLIDTISPTR